MFGTETTKKKTTGGREIKKKQKQKSKKKKGHSFRGRRRRKERKKDICPAAGCDSHAIPWQSFPVSERGDTFTCFFTGIQNGCKEPSCYTFFLRKPFFPQAENKMKGRDGGGGGGKRKPFSLVIQVALQSSGVKKKKKSGMIIMTRQTPPVVYRTEEAPGRVWGSGSEVKPKSGRRMQGACIFTASGPFVRRQSEASVRPSGW
ncbi:hypothetical protein L249_2615 [Ophiocordyceps polyrhachis-furcata BCC 54312]|uniref:Uncharacterized protein n=1 Tax=Ophiocordyceps polyrhachis-furcata BCC 54312 TaxID=1330021 RepID=A0A367LS89_9HYPO|nr:hypothetical protein L249_2615 [Ophiocordyceps polyrhachis-furcata BCC 54312]